MPSDHQPAGPASDPLLHAISTIDGRKVLDRRYVLTDLLGQGGMGVVYRGYHKDLQVDVAIKCLDPGLVRRDKDFVLRFKQEARAAAKIEDENVIRVIDVADDSGVHFLVMEYVEGEDARRRVARKGALSPAEAVRIILGAARGLRAAHRIGLVHRDMKPDNIMVGVDGLVKVADLGLAKEIGGDSGLTVSGAGMGTPRYMPPEQFADAKNVGPTADVYSLGATLYFLLVGVDAVPGDSFLTVADFVRDRPFPDVRQARPDVPAELAELVLACTKKQPSERPLDAGELVARIESLNIDLEGSLADEHAGSTQAQTVVSPPPLPPPLPPAAKAQERGGSASNANATGHEFTPQMADDLYRKGKVLFDMGHYADAAVPLQEAAAHGHADAQSEYAFLCKIGKGVPQDLEQAEHWYQKAAEAGHAHACHNLAVLLLERDEAKGIPAALGWFKVNAGQGHAQSQLQLGHWYLRGIGVEADLTEALRLFKAAADQGCEDAQHMVSLSTRYGAADHRGPYPSFPVCESRAQAGDFAAMRLLAAYAMLGFGCQADARLARDYMERAAAGGDIPAIRSMGLFLFDEDPAQSVAHWERASAAGDANAAYLLALSLMDGTGVAKDTARAIELLEQAANKGFVDALVVLGDHHRVGDVIQQDLERGLYWHTRAAQAGHTESQWHAGLLLIYGTGVPVDVAMGMHWLETAASRGWADAQSHIGVRFLQGDGVDQDLKRSTQWLRAAAEQGHANGTYVLGICYLKGDGVPKDAEFGIHLLRMAAAKGHAGAAADLETLNA